MDGFYWLIPNALAGCRRPGGFGYGAEWAARCDADLAWLRRQGIAAILSLTEEPIDPAMLARHGLASLHLPVADLTPPTPDQLRAGLAFIDEHRAHGQAVAVHCLMGQGRTGTILAAYLIRGGLDHVSAVAAVRAVCPGAVENALQEEALAAFAARRDWLV